MPNWKLATTNPDEIHVLAMHYAKVTGVENVILPQRYPEALVGDLGPAHELLSLLCGAFSLADADGMSLSEAHQRLSESAAATSLLSVESTMRPRVAVAALSYMRWAGLVLDWQVKQTGVMSYDYGCMRSIRAVVPYMLERDCICDAAVAADLLDGVAYFCANLSGIKFPRVVTFLEKQFGPSGVAAHESLRAAIVRAATNLRTDAINPSTLGMTGEATRVGGTTLGQLLDRMDALTGVKTRADPNFKPFGPRTK